LWQTSHYARPKEPNQLNESKYTSHLADTICCRMAEGESLRAICRGAGMPSEGTVRGWALRDVDGFAARYRQARDLLVEFWSNEIIDLADQTDLDPRDRQIRIDTRKWLMSKLAPRRYGERLLMAGDAENPVRVMHDHVSIADLSPEQLDALERFTTALIVANSG
jgi:hypothetical protein